MNDSRLNRRMMLISNSFCHGKGYLEHCGDALQKFLGPIQDITFIPYALKDWDAYTKTAQEGMAKFGIRVKGIQEFGPGFDDSIRGIQESNAIFVGGGNTFRLLKTLDEKLLLDEIRGHVDHRNMLYLGASAGANVACPTIMTTNDMPIVKVDSFKSLNLFPYQINAHFVDADPNSKHMGETREKRIAEYHEENKRRVIGLREGSWIVVERGVAYLKGDTGAKLFMPNSIPTEWWQGQPIGLW